MNTRLLPIKSDNTIIIYSVEYDEKRLKNFIESLNFRFGYKEKKNITTTMIQGKLLSTGKYDTLNSICHVEDDFNILENLGREDIYTERVKANITISYRSMIGEIIKKTFLISDSKSIINLTDIIKLSNHVWGFSNSFVFNALLDVKDTNKGKTWNDPSRRFLSNNEYTRYIENIKKNINNDNVILNKYEKNLSTESINYIIHELRRILTIEEIGVYPIQTYKQDIYRILTEFGKRNEDIKFFYDILNDAPTNINGVTKFENLKDQIEDYYNLEKEEQKRKEQINEDNNKIKRFLQDRQAA